MTAEGRAQDPSDDLLQQAADESSLAELIRRHEAEIRRVARLRLGPLLRPYLDSVDLVQSVYVELLRGIRQHKLDVSDVDRLVSLSATIIQQKVAHLWRRLQRRKQLHGKLDGLRELAQTLVFAHAAPPDPSTEAARREQVQQLLARLQPVDRRLIQLRLEGFTTAEAARQLELDGDVLRVRLSRLRKTLTEQGILADWL